MLLILLLLPSVWSWSSTPEGGQDGRLVQVHVVYTHGHTAPAKFYPKDPHASSPIWSNGPLELTVLGIQQGFRLGQQLKTRYGTLLPKKRAWKAVKATSSDTTRTLMTSNILLTGLLTTGNEIWSNFSWIPVPTAHVEHDGILSSDINCPNYKDLLIRTKSRDDSENQMFYRILTNYTGEEIDSAKSLLNLYTCMELEMQANLTLPKWTRPLYRTIRRHAVSALGESTKTLELKRLRSGSLVNLLLKYKSSWNIHLYSTHGTVLSSLMDSFGFEITEVPSSASAFIVEHRSYHGVIYTQFWYKGGPEGGLIRLKLPGCDVPCPLEQLKNLVEPLITVNWFEECKLVKYERDIGSELRCVFAFIIVVVLLGMYILKTYNKENYIEL